MPVFFGIAALMMTVADAAPNTTIGGGQTQQPPLDPTDAGTITQTPYTGILPVPTIQLPELVEVYAEPYHTSLVTFLVYDGEIQCHGEEPVAGLKLGAETRKDFLRHVIVHDDGTFDDVAVIDVYHPTILGGTTISLHGSELRDDDTFHILGVITSTAQNPMCGEYLVGIEFVGECDGSIMHITSDPPGIFNGTATDGYHAYCRE